VVHLIMLNELLDFITAFKHDDRRTHLGPLPFCCEGVRTMDTTEAVVCFVVL
jgi:hypothetical protein